MFQVVLAIKEESGDISTETREKQVANFVGPTLADLGLYEWMEKHGGMVSCVAINKWTVITVALLTLSQIFSLSPKIRVYIKWRRVYCPVQTPIEEYRGHLVQY